MSKKGEREREREREKKKEKSLRFSDGMEKKKDVKEEKPSFYRVHL